MKISQTKLKKLCANNGLTLSRLLQEAGVSKNAYYALARKESLLPKSLQAIADRLGVRPSAFLEESDSEREKARRLMEEAQEIARRHRVDGENVRHCLLLLQERPIERLRRALVRGRRVDLRERGIQVP
jgi:transcriptional regulator with XRE-family HTH domain